MTFSKIIVAFLLINGAIWIYASYYLACIGRTQIAETLSKTVVIEVLGVLALYAIKALLENLSKNNIWPDRVRRCDDDDEPTNVEIAPEPIDNSPVTKTRI